MEQNGVPETSIALCLSGGGLRATLFHLGLVKALRCYDIDGSNALSKVSEIYSVSGGSILSAHLVNNWDKYIGDDQTFSAMEEKLLSFARRNVRDRVVRRWILFGWLGKGRSYWLQKEYENLLGSKSIADSYRSQASFKPPKLYILTTSFKTGELCSFSPEDFEIERRTLNGPTVISTSASHLPISYAVATSSAFPPMFPPIKLTHEMLGNPESEEFLIPLYLSDGGVYDNLGFEKFQINQRYGATRPKVLTISNAGGSFRADIKSTFSDVVSRNVRATDILMRRVAESTEDAAQNMAGVTYISVRIGATFDDPQLPVATQQRLRAVRTDLDQFDRSLCGLLIDHGFRVGSNALLAQGWLRNSNAAKNLIESTGVDLDAIAAKAAKRSLWSLALGFKGDFVALSTIWLVSLSVLLGGLCVVGEARRARASQATITANEPYLILLDKIKQAYVANDSRKLSDLLGIAGRSPDASTAAAEGSGQNLATGSDQPVIPHAQIPSGIAVHSQKVYIQFAGAIKRDEIIELNSSLRGDGWATQSASGERLAVAAGLHEVRYSGNNKSAAEELALAINKTKIIARDVVAKPAPIISLNVLEVWISR
jgi:predicted acylesterase/phospholipase RssA